MATLQIRVNIPSAVLPDTEPNRQRIFIFSGIGATASGAGPFGNFGPRNQNPQSEHHFDLNNPIVPGAISVSGYARVLFDSIDFKGDQSLAGSVSHAIEAGYVIVEDTAAPGVPLTRSNIDSYV